jgi:hypothetical protein
VNIIFQGEQQRQGHGSRVKKYTKTTKREGRQGIVAYHINIVLKANNSKNY